MGHSESLTGIRHSLTLVAPAIYRRPPARETMSANRIRVLVVDDSAVVRKLISEALAADPEIEVVGHGGRSLCGPRPDRRAGAATC